MVQDCDINWLWLRLGLISRLGVRVIEGRWESSDILPTDGKVSAPEGKACPSSRSLIVSKLLHGGMEVQDNVRGQKTRCRVVMFGLGVVSKPRLSFHCS